MRFHLDKEDKRVVMHHTLYRQVADENFTVCGKAIQKGDKGGWSEDTECGWIQSGNAFAGTKIEYSIIDDSAIIKRGTVKNSRVAGIVEGEIVNSNIDINSRVLGVVKDSSLIFSNVDGVVNNSTLIRSTVNSIVKNSKLESCIVFKGIVLDSDMYICNIDTEGVVTLRAQLCDVRCPINLYFEVKSLNIDDEAFVVTRNGESALWCNGKWYGSKTVFNSRLEEVLKIFEK